MMGKKKRQNDSNQNVKLYAFDFCPQPQLSIPYAKEVNCNKLYENLVLMTCLALYIMATGIIPCAISAYN